MKLTRYLMFLSALLTMTAFPQSRDFRIHTRGMLRETEFNTGEIGRAFDNGTVPPLVGYPSMEWPPNSSTIINRKTYPGQNNSFGGGLYLGGTRGALRLYDYCGAVTDNNGNSTQVENVYSDPISIERTENYPVFSDGRLNLAYDPNEAEETIVAKWRSHNLGLLVTRTSRAWSFPGYNSFIIYEYEIENTGADTVTDAFVAWGYGFGPSEFGYERQYNRWAEADYRSVDQFARYDLNRYMTYNHDRIGKPDSAFFNAWSMPGNRGALNSPQAAGLVVLHYDYSHLADSNSTTTIVNRNDRSLVWDNHGKLKQPWLNRYENGNLYPTKIQTWLDPLNRKTGPFDTHNDSVYYSDHNYYWIGRAKPSQTLGWSQPVGHGYGFGPYTIPPNSPLHFAVAEVVGYGPGRATDSVYSDLGGGIRGEPEPYRHPVPSWYKALTYDNVGTPPMIGSDYLQTHPLPWYILDTNVVSIRDVADRAIQIYTGDPLIKYDTAQFEPRTTPDVGAYSTVSVPVPAPVITIENTIAASNKIIWGPDVESFSSPRLLAPFRYYRVLHAPDPLGPWTLIDSVGRHDPRYFNDTVYTVIDTSSTLGSYSYYAVLSVDSLGSTSGMTNITTHLTQAPAAKSLGKVYVAPNPLVVTNGANPLENDPHGEVTDRLQFFGLTLHCTIRIFSYSGQLIQTIQHDANSYTTPWYQISRNNQLLASGVYFFVVEDGQTGARSHGKFVIIH